MRIGVLADTHGFLDDQVFSLFEGVDHILHAGDIGGGAKRCVSAYDLLAQLRKIAPVTAVSGNVDGFEESGIRSLIRMKFEGKAFLLVHQFFEKGKLREDITAYLRRHPVDVVVFGHSHQPLISSHQGTLLFNPGSAGKKRFKLPRAVGIIEIRESKLFPGIIYME
ncbi:MAG: metallophosphoesterase family protein [Nitrospiria bacterium]